MKHRCLPALLLTAPLLLLAACGDDEPADPVAEANDDDGGGDGDEGGGEDRATGTVVVHLQPTDAIFMEGFELGLRIDDPGTGEELKRVVWSEHAAATGGDPYTAVLEQPLRAGPVRIGADVNIGIGPGPEPPDLDADRLPCELELDLAAGETVEVEIGFDDSAPDCARVVG